jgi:hypothetical protein
MAFFLDLCRFFLSCHHATVTLMQHQGVVVSPLSNSLLGVSRSFVYRTNKSSYIDDLASTLEPSFK